MPDDQEQNFQSELRQAQMSSANQPDEAPEEEAPEEESETLESPEDEQTAQKSLLAKRTKAAAQKKAGQGIKLTGRAQQAVSFAFQRVGTILVSFGVGTGFTIIGLIIGLPLLLIGAGFLAIGLLSAVTARLTLATGETMVEKAKKEEKSLAKGGGGGMMGAMRGAGEAASGIKKTAGVIAAPFIYIGCTILGLVSGFIFLAVVVGVLFSSLAG